MSQKQRVCKTILKICSLATQQNFCRPGRGDVETNCSTSLLRTLKLVILKRRQAKDDYKSIRPHQLAPSLLYGGTSGKFCWKVQKDKRGFTDIPERKSVRIQTLPLKNTTTGHVLTKKYFFIPKAMTIQCKKYPTYTQCSDCSLCCWSQIHYTVATI